MPTRQADGVARRSVARSECRPAPPFARSAAIPHPRSSTGCDALDPQPQDRAQVRAVRLSPIHDVLRQIGERFNALGRDRLRYVDHWFGPGRGSTVRQGDQARLALLWIRLLDHLETVRVPLDEGE